MRLRLKPRDTAFFDLFEAAGANLVTGAGLLQDLVAAPAAERAGVAAALRDAEHASDEITHQLLRKLNTTFVTPFDREDIYALASAVDDCMDAMEEAADTIVLYRMADALPPAVAEQASIVRMQAEITSQVLPLLRTLGDVQPLLVEVNRLENLADQVFRGGLADLFEGAADAVLVIKIKDVLMAMEAAADAFEAASNRVETIVLKES
ncbi:MAG: DUF47 family protein [Kineosporiaceae bacterium]